MLNCSGGCPRCFSRSRDKASRRCDPASRHIPACANAPIPPASASPPPATPLAPAPDLRPRRHDLPTCVSRNSITDSIISAPADRPRPPSAPPCTTSRISCSICPGSAGLFRPPSARPIDPPRASPCERLSITRSRQQKPRRTRRSSPRRVLRHRMRDRHRAKQRDHHRHRRRQQVMHEPVSARILKHPQHATGSRRSPPAAPSPSRNQIVSSLHDRLEQPRPPAHPGNPQLCAGKIARIPQRREKEGRYYRQHDERPTTATSSHAFPRSGCAFALVGLSASRQTPPPPRAASGFVFPSMHARKIAVGSIVESAQVQHAMNRIQQHLLLAPPSARRRAARTA